MILGTVAMNKLIPDKNVVSLSTTDLVFGGLIFTLWYDLRGYKRNLIAKEKPEPLLAAMVQNPPQ